VNKNAVELAVSLLVGAVSVFMLWEAWSYSGQSRYMPVAVTAFALAMSLVWAKQSARRLAGGAQDFLSPERAEVLRFAILLVVMTAYVLGVTYIGFFASTILLVPGLAFLAGYRNVPMAALATAVFVVILYLVFRMLLSIPLPPDYLLDLVGLS
jgi:putative tricarboxylic transport membrane protein